MSERERGGGAVVLGYEACVAATVWRQRPGALSSAHMVKRNIKNSVILWSIHLRIFTFGFLLCLRPNLDANLDAAARR